MVPGRLGPPQRPNWALGLFRAGYVQNEEQSNTTGWKKIKTKTTTEEDYHLRMEQRIEALMAKVDAGELTLEDLTPEDRQVIIEIRNQNEV